VALFAFTLAALIRKPFVMIMVAAAAHLFLQAIHRKIVWWHLLLPVAFLPLWLGYELWNRSLEADYGTLFLGRFLPAQNFGEFRDVVVQMSAHWLPEYFSVGQWLVILLLLAFVVVGLVKLRARPAPIFSRHIVQFVILFVGTLAYFLLMARQFYYHDYYFIDCFYFPWLLLVIAGLTAFPKGETKIGGRILGGIALSLTLVFASGSKAVQNERYIEHDWDQVHQTWLDFAGIDTWLDNQGVGADMSIVVLDAYSTNVPLICARRKGYTTLSTSKADLKAALDFPAKYLLIRRASVLPDVYNHWNQIVHHLEFVNGTDDVYLYRFSENAMTAAEGIDFTHLFPPGENSGTLDEVANIRFESNVEFGPTFDYIVGPETPRRWYLSVEVAFMTRPKNLACVLSVTDSTGKLKHYQDYPLHAQIDSLNEPQEYAFAFALNEDLQPSDQIRTYLHNRSSDEFVIMKQRIWYSK